MKPTKKMTKSFEQSKKDKEVKGVKEMSKAEKAMDKKMMSGMKGKKK